MLPGWNTNINYTAGDYGFVIPSDNYRSSSIPSNEKRIMVSVHYYDPWDFCGERSSSITQWGYSATDSSKVSGYGDESYINDMFHMLYQKFTSQGYPVVIGEYGAIDKLSHDSSNTAMDVFLYGGIMVTLEYMVLAYLTVIITRWYSHRL